MIDTAVRPEASLAAAPMTTILPVLDLPRARQFYEQSLGLHALGAKPDGKFVFRCGNEALLALFPKAEGTKAEHTAASFEVDDIAAHRSRDRGPASARRHVSRLRPARLSHGEPHMRARSGARRMVLRSGGNILCILENLATA